MSEVPNCYKGALNGEGFVGIEVPAGERAVSSQFLSTHYLSSVVVVCIVHRRPKR